MTRFIRWQGIAGFFVIVLFFAVFIYFFAESFIKSGLEFGVEEATGAEVNVTEVKVNYSPISITVNDFQATDASAPDTNLVSFESATASIDLWQYIFGKVIIDEVSVEGLAFSSERQKAGKVFSEPAEKEAEVTTNEKPLFTTPDVSLPDTRTLLADANLLTVKEGEKLKVTYQEERKKLKALKAKLPNKKMLVDYQRQVKALSKAKINSLADIEQLKNDYDAIKQKVNSDKAIVKQTSQQLKASKQRLAAQVVALKKAPKQDWQVIEDKYQLDKVDGADFAHILFGEKARDYYKYGEMAFEQIAPLLASGEKEAQAALIAEEKAKNSGRFVHFAEESPLPDLLIKKAYLSIITVEGTFVAEIDEVTHQHWVRNKQTRYHVKSSKLLNGGDSSVEGLFALNEVWDFSSAGSWNFNNAQLTDVELQKGDKLSLSIDSALLAGKGDYNIVEKKISSANRIDLSKAKFSGQGNSQISEILVSTFQSMDTLALGINLSGDVTSPEWQITSPLNNVLKGALQKQLEQKLTKFKAKVQSGLNKKVAEQLNVSEQVAGEALQLEKLLSSTDKTLDNLLSSDLVKDQKNKYIRENKNKVKKKAESKVKDELKKKLGKFF